MDRSNTDPFWNHVVRMDDGSMKCEFCDRPFHKGTSISRIKWHLSGERGRGVAICGQVPKDVQEAALLAMRGGNQRKKIVASSSNVNDNAISSCPQEENNEVYNLAGDAGSIRMAAVKGTEQGVGEGRTTSCAEAGNHMENMAGEIRRIDGVNSIEGLIGVVHETREDAGQIMEQLSLADVEMAEHGESLSQQGEVYSPGTLQEWMESLKCNTDFQLQLGCSSPEGLVLDASETVRGVATSGQVPKDVQEAAFLAMRGGNKRQKTLASSSNVNDNAISSYPQEQNDEVDHLVGDAGRIQMVQGTEQGVGEGRPSRAGGNLMENMAGEMMYIGRSITAEEHIVDAHETRGEASQAPDIMGQAIGKCSDEIHNFSMRNDIENETGRLPQPVVGASSSGGLLQPVAGTSSSGRLAHNICETRGDALPTSSTKLAGKAFEENKNMIWSWLMNDEVSSIGIYAVAKLGYFHKLLKPSTTKASALSACLLLSILKR